MINKQQLQQHNPKRRSKFFENISPKILQKNKSKKILNIKNDIIIIIINKEKDEIITTIYLRFF